jgi:MFS family permease
VEEVGISTKPLRPNCRHQSPWFILIIVLLTSIAASLSQFKVPPIMPLLMEAFSQSGSRAGLLMSVFALTGLFLAIPAGFILQKLGYRAVGLMALFCLIVGAGIGAFSRGMGTMLASRFIEGAGMSLMSVVAPAIIALWFASKRRGKAMGVWSIWVPLGSTIMFILAPSLAGYWGWKGVWWFGFFYTIVVGLFFYLFIRSNPRTSSGPGNSSPAKGLMGQNLRVVLHNRDLWLISLVFCCFNFVYVAFITWAPTFLHQIRHATMTRASLLVSVTSIVSIAAGPTAGWISDKVGSRKVICTVPLFLMAFLFPLSSSVTENLFLVLTAGIGFAGGFVPTGVFSAGVEVVGDERMAGMAMAVIQIGQNSGMLLGPLVFGWAVQSGGGWQTAFWILGPISVLGAISGWVAKIR